MAPLVTAIREPQRGGSQAFVSDLARGLTGRGHEVHVYAASGSVFQASAWRRIVRVDAILPPYVPTHVIPWSREAGEGAIFAGRLSPEKGAAEAIDIARTAGVPIDVYGDAYDAEYSRDQIG